MKSKLLSILTAVILILIPGVNFGQTAPALGTTSGFALFTGTGAFDNSGATIVTGDIGSHAYSPTGFPLGIVYGNIYNASDGITATAAANVLTAYSNLTQVVGTAETGVLDGRTLSPGVHIWGAATSLGAGKKLTLDGGGDPNALFVIRIGGALATGTFTEILLTNSASICNVYWQVDGAFTLGDNSIFRGTLIATGAIHLLEASSLLGRGLSTTGAIDTHNNIVTNSCSCVAPAAPTASVTTQPTCIVSTGTITVTAPANGSGISYTVTGTNPVVAAVNNSTGLFTGLAPGVYNVTTTNGGCVSAAIPLTVNVFLGASEAPIITLVQPTCIVATGTITVVSPTEIGMTYSIDNSTYTNATGIFTLVPPGTYTVTSKNSDGCISAGTIATINAAEIIVGCVSPGTIVTINSTEISVGCVSPGTIVTINATKISLGCVSTGTIVTINAQPATPAASGAITGTAIVCQGQTGLVYSVPVITNATDYIWTLPAGATITAGANTNSITVGFSAISSSDNITVQGSNNCANGTVSAPFTVVVNNCVNKSLAEPQIGFDLKSYPNPFNDHVYFELQLEADAKVSLEIFKINGVKEATIYSDDVRAFQDYRFEYTPENSSTGTYIYRLIVDERILFTGKVIHK